MTGGPHLSAAGGSVGAGSGPAGPQAHAGLGCSRRRADAGERQGATGGLHWVGLRKRNDAGGLRAEQG
jgi:hypothetical protein